MARSWQYPRWRRIVVQLVLWIILGATMGVAALLVRHRRLVGSVDLATPRTVDLPDGVRVSVRLPKGWPVDHDAAEHGENAEDTDTPGTGNALRVFEAHEPAGSGDDANGADRALVVLCQPLSTVVSAKGYLKRSGLLDNTVPRDPREPAGGALPVAGVDGWWATYRRRVPAAPGLEPQAHAEYVAVGVVPVGESSLGVLVVLDCSEDDADPPGDRALIGRVAAGITVERGGR